MHVRNYALICTYASFLIDVWGGTYDCLPSDFLS